jgi:peptidoglycan hydrolase-like protein with peptidoglycan-binding domain
MKNFLSSVILSMIIVGQLETSFAFSRGIAAYDDAPCGIANYMKIGSKDSKTDGDVTRLQKLLIENKYMNGTTTGYYGNMTASAVKKFQKMRNIKPTGSVGEITGKYLNGSFYCSTGIGATTNEKCKDGSTVIQDRDGVLRKDLCSQN